MAPRSSMALSGVGCLALALGARAQVVGDSSAMVQEAVKAHQHEASQASSNLLIDRIKALAGAGQPAPPTGFDCQKHPKLCQAPFNCQSWNMAEGVGYAFQGMAADGQPNLRTWCMAPQYDDYIHACIVEKNLKKAGEIQFQWSLNQHSGTDEMDGSYCFIEGHCTNTAVSDNTTLEEARQMCDDRYGRSGWSDFGKLTKMLAVIPSMFKPGAHDPKTGFHSLEVTKVFLKAACAMGNYHCDVGYCRETYCKKPYYINKYQHLQPKAPGHLIQQKDWL